ncbi:MAG TPA: multiheme c-type cytochrome [Myxococcota bacterium]|nr:multiheme c-type cytochrome [Myxococcota bacterium]
MMTRAIELLAFSKLVIRIFALASMLLLGGCKKENPLQSPYMAPFRHLTKDSFALVFLSNVEGYVEPCGCTPDPLGGIARFAAVFRKIGDAFSQNIALIDTGNLLFDSLTRNDADLCQDNARIDLLLSTMVDLGLKSVFLGPYDRARGTKYSDNLWQKYALTYLAPLGQIGPRPSPWSHVNIVHGEDFDISIMGVELSEKKSALELRKNIENGVKDISKNRRNKATIVISQMPLSLTKEVFSLLPGVDVVIQSQSASFSIARPERLGENGPILVEGGRQNQYLTVLTLENLSKRTTKPLKLDIREFERKEKAELLTSRISSLQKQIEHAEGARLDFLNERIELAKNEYAALNREDYSAALTEPGVVFTALALTRKIEADRAVNKSLITYEKNVPFLVKQCEANLKCPKSDAHEARYVGANTCKACHAQAFVVWEDAVFTRKALDEAGHTVTRSIGHSKAWQTLLDGNKDQDRSCVGCHSVGFMEKGGYCKVSEVASLKNVQCESCHGPGSLHAQSGDKNFIRRQVTEQTCRGCHHVPHIESYDSFNYEEKLLKILGPGHGDSLLKEITHKLKASDS